MPIYGSDHPERAAEPHAVAATPAPTCPVRAGGRSHRAARPRAAGRRACDTKIIGYDHNWSEHPNDIANTPPGEDPETEYPTLLLESPAARWIAGTAYHCYAGDQKRMTALHRALPATRRSGSPSAPARTVRPTRRAQVFSDTLKWHARNLTLGTTRNWAQSVVTWNLALRPRRWPAQRRLRHLHRRGHRQPDGTVTRNAEYYTLGHLARFVRPGRVRVASSSYGTHRLERTAR